MPMVKRICSVLTAKVRYASSLTATHAILCFGILLNSQFNKTYLKSNSIYDIIAVPVQKQLPICDSTLRLYFAGYSLSYSLNHLIQHLYTYSTTRT